MNLREFLEEQYKAGLIELSVYTRELRVLLEQAELESIEIRWLILTASLKME